MTQPLKLIDTDGTPRPVISAHSQCTQFTVSVNYLLQLAKQQCPDMKDLHLTLQYYSDESLLFVDIITEEIEDIAND